MFIVYTDILTGNLTIKLLLLTIVASTYIWVDSSLEGVSCSCSKGKHCIIYIIQSIIDFQCYIIFVHHTFITSGCWRWDMSMSCSPQTKINHNVLNVWAKSVSRSDYILHMQWLVTGGSLFFIWIPICLHEVISSLPGFLLWIDSSHSKKQIFLIKLLLFVEKLTSSLCWETPFMTDDDQVSEHHSVRAERAGLVVW